jgi:hypothetical protein
MRILPVAALLLAGCSAAQTTTATNVASTVVTDGRLYCSPAGQVAAAGAIGVVALVSPSGAAILAKGASSSFVAAACAVINAVPVVPPPTGTVVPTQVVSVPAG